MVSQKLYMLMQLGNVMDREFKNIMQIQLNLAKLYHDSTINHLRFVWGKGRGGGVPTAATCKSSVYLLSLF